MKEKLRNMYEEGLLDTTGLLNAVAKDWITITDVIEIVGEDNALSVVMSAKLSEISNACNAVIVNGVDIKFGEETVHYKNAEAKERGMLTGRQPSRHCPAKHTA